MNEESGRFHIELFGDVFTDFDQIVAALAALAGGWLVAVFNAWQMIWQRLTAGTAAWRSGYGSFSRRINLLDFRMNRRHIGQHRFFKQAELIG